MHFENLLTFDAVIAKINLAQFLDTAGSLAI